MSMAIGAASTPVTVHPLSLLCQFNEHWLGPSDIPWRSASIGVVPIARFPIPAQLSHPGKLFHRGSNILKRLIGTIYPSNPHLDNYRDSFPPFRSNSQTVSDRIAPLSETYARIPCGGRQGILP